MHAGDAMACSLRWIFFIILMPLILHAAEDEGGWSESVKGLKARLVISPLKRGNDGHDHFTLSFQMERHDQLGNLLEVAYTPDMLKMSVVDEDGKVIPWISGAGNRMGIPWKPLILPRGASLIFPLGLSLWTGSAEYLYFDSSFDEWMIPSHSTTDFYLTGKFVIPPVPRDFSNSDVTWDGTLILPKMKFPKIP
jgi:hypothetical protein